MAKLGSPVCNLASAFPHSIMDHSLTGDHFDPSFYLLHDIIPALEQQQGASKQQDEHCRKMAAAEEFWRDFASQSWAALGNSSSSSGGGGGGGPEPYRRDQFSLYQPALLPLCDSNCALIGGCVKTGRCRCVVPLCGPELHRPIPFPFSKFAYRNQVTFPEVAVLKAANASFESVLTGPAALFYRKVSNPKVFVLDINVFKVANLTSKATAEDLLRKSPCSPPEQILQEAFRLMNASLESADFVFVPFYQELLWKRLGNRTEEVLRAVHREALQRIHHSTSSSSKSKSKSNPLLLYPMTHAYGGFQDFVPDYRRLKGQSMMQSSVLHDAVVLSPMGDFNTLAYLPHKDVVIPAATCGDETGPGNANKQRAFLDLFRDASQVRPSLARKNTVFFGGELADFAGNAARSAVLAGTLFPRLKGKTDLTPLTQLAGLDYARVLNDSVFCPHLFGAAGWSSRLSEAIFAGCIPVLTSVCNCDCGDGSI